jgi:hypothetical protein
MTSTAYTKLPGIRNLPEAQLLCKVLSLVIGKKNGERDFENSGLVLRTGPHRWLPARVSPIQPEPEGRKGDRLRRCGAAAMRRIRGEVVNNKGRWDRSGVRSREQR